MVGDLVAGYLGGLPSAQAEELARVNGPGLAALRGYLGSGEPVAFLGAGVSAPLYPLWDGLIRELVDAASGWLTDKQAATCRALASSSPESVVEIVRQSLSTGMYREVVLRVRTDPETGRSWTPVQELVCRCGLTEPGDSLHTEIGPIQFRSGGSGWCRGSGCGRVERVAEGGDGAGAAGRG